MSDEYPSDHECPVCHSDVLIPYTAQSCQDCVGLSPTSQDSQDILEKLEELSQEVHQSIAKRDHTDITGLDMDNYTPSQQKRIRVSYDLCGND